jgi:hypothetical protein
VLVDESLTIARAEEMRRRLLDTVATIIEPIGDVEIVFTPKHHA